MGQFKLGIAASWIVALLLPLAAQERPYEPTAQFCEKIKAAVKANKVAKSALAGTTGRGTPFLDVPSNGRVLVGFNVTLAEYTRNRPIVGSLQAVYRHYTGASEGPVFGTAGPADRVIRVVAKKGYAVGAVTAKAGIGVDGFKVIYYALTPSGLDRSRSYESEWIGGSPRMTKEVTLGGDGQLVLGVFGHVQDRVRFTLVEFGLVTLKE